MKYFLTFAMAVTCCVALLPGAIAQDIRFQAVSQALRNSVNTLSYTSDSYGRRLNRYRNNYGYNQGYNAGHNAGHNWHNNSYGNHGNTCRYNYYGGNYSRVNAYRSYYRSNRNGGYYNGYRSRPGFSIGGGSSRVFFGF